MYNAISCIHTVADPGILEGGSCHGPQKGMSVGIFKLTSKKNLGGGGTPNPLNPLLTYMYTKLCNKISISLDSLLKP